MDNKDPREPQTQIKHEILAEYLDTWSGIITSGLYSTYQKFKRSGKPFDVHFVYVDCFAFSGKYEKDGNRAYGSPVIGIEALDKIKQHTETNFGYPVTTNVILAEKEPKTYQELLETLNEKGYINRVVESPDLRELNHGDIALFRGDYSEYIDEILDYTSEYTWSLYLLDPYGSPGELSIIKQVVTQRRTDAIIYFPYNDLQKKLGSVENDNPEHIHHKHLQYYDAMFGSKDWREVVFSYSKLLEEGFQIEARNLTDYAMPQLVDKYEQLLLDADPDLTIKKIPLRMKTHDRPLYYLYLTTRDPTGALSLNKILDSARLQERLFREEHRQMKKRTKSLFDMDTMLELEDTTTSREPEVDAENLAIGIYNICRGQQMTYRDVLRKYANSPYYPEDLKKAVGVLKKRKQIEYKGKLYNSTNLRFN